MIYGEIADGATSDLHHANVIARKMVKMFGMSRLGRVFYPDDGGNPFLGGIDAVRAASVNTARRRPARSTWKSARSSRTRLTEVRKILLDRRDALEALAKRLMEKEVDRRRTNCASCCESHYPGPKLVPASTAIVSAERDDDEVVVEVRESKPV